LELRRREVASLSSIFFEVCGSKEMKNINETVDVVIAGGGTAGHVAALQAARAGITTSVIEAGTMLGGTMTSGGVYMPNHFFSTERPVVLGIPWELYTKSKDIEGLPIPDYKKRRSVENPSYYSYINVPAWPWARPWVQLRRLRYKKVFRRGMSTSKTLSPLPSNMALFPFKPNVGNRKNSHKGTKTQTITVYFFESLTGSRPGAEIPRRSSSDPSWR
jgi:hypothetical protein